MDKKQKSEKGKIDVMELRSVGEILVNTKQKEKKRDDGKRVLASIYGFDILSDTVYTVRDRPDMDAPDAYVNLGVSKCPSIPDNGVVVSCRYDLNKKSYDLGLLETSLSLVGMGREERQMEIGRRKDNIFLPAEAEMGRTLIHVSDDFYKELRIEVGKDMPFNTGEPVDAFNLYIALLSGLLSPVREFHHSFKSAMYYVEGAVGGYNFRSEVEGRKVDAIAAFAVMLRDERSRALDIMLQLKIIAASDDLNDGFLKPVFNAWVNLSPSNPSAFLGEISKIENNPHYADVLKVSRMIDNLIFNNKMVQDMSGVKLDGRVIGNTPIDTAQAIFDNDDSNALKTIIERYESLNI